MTSKELVFKNKQELESNKEHVSACKVFSPDVDIYENANEIVMQVDMPGVGKDNVKINLENDVLTIAGDINAKQYETLKPVYSEYNVGHYKRQFSLGEQVDQDKISAELENGTLKLVLPKLERAKSRSIVIR